VALIAEKDRHLPFDIAQKRWIFVDHTDLASADSCREQIVIQLREALGDNAVVDSPIATSIDVRALASGDKVERNTGELVTTVEELSKMQRLSLGRMDRFEAMIEDLAMQSFDNLDMRTFHDLTETYPLLRAAADKDKEIVSYELRSSVLSQ